MFEQRRMQDILQQGRFTGARHAGDADQAPERQPDIDVAQVVLTRADDLEPAVVLCFAGCAPRRWQPYCTSAGQVVRGERSRRREHLFRAPPRDDPTAVLAGTGTEVEQSVGLLHDLRIVLHHEQRVAGVAQPVHDADDALHIAGMQSDRGFIQHEQGVHQRSAERGGEVDALHLTARQRA